MKRLLFLIPLFFIPFLFSWEAKAEVNTGWVCIQPKKNIAAKVGQVTNKGDLKLYTAKGREANQKFFIKKLSDGYYKIGSGLGAGYKILDNSLKQVEWNNASNQKWKIIEYSDSTYQIVSANKALTYSDKKIGTPLKMTEKGSGDDQRFYIKPFSEKYTVTFVLDTGNVRQSVKKGENAKAPATPTKTGYNFAGWDKGFSNITSNTTIKPKWTAKTVKVNFHFKGKTYTETYTYGKAGQTFGMNNKDVWDDLVGWSEKENATSKQYDTYSTVSNAWINKNAGTKDLYAVLNPKKTQVIFHRNSTTAGTYIETYVYGQANKSFGMNLTSKTGAFGTWTYAGHKLLGWSFDKDAKKATYSVYSEVSDDWISKNTGTVNLYAVWTTENNLKLIDNVWRKITDGKPDYNYTGFAKNDSGWYFLKNGKVDVARDEVLQGTVEDRKDWYYVHGGKVQQNHTGLASNPSGTWYFKNGELQWNYTGYITYNNFKYCVKNGKSLDYGESKYGVKNGRKTYILGDSRTARGYYSQYSSNWNQGADTNYATKGLEIWEALGGSGYDYMTKALNTIQADNVTDIIILHGVNNLWSEKVGEYTQEKRYISKITEKAKEFTAKGAKIYYVSVNPCAPALVSDKESNKGTAYNKKIEDWNSYMKRNLPNTVKYIDVHSKMGNELMKKTKAENEIGTYDNVHYTKAANLKIFDYVLHNKAWY